MTTIVYDHISRKIAFDGRVTSNGFICTDQDIKWMKDGEDYWFFAGSICDRERFIKYIKAKDPDPPRWEIDCSAFLVRAGKVYQCLVSEKGEPTISELSYSDAIGSGWIFALAALDLGKTTKGAILYAMTRDTGTGGKVTVFDCEKMEFRVD